jgi:hypothetical protein
MRKHDRAKQHIVKLEYIEIRSIYACCEDRQVVDVAEAQMPKSWKRDRGNERSKVVGRSPSLKVKVL